jgi:hypothetical protein
VLLTRQAGVVAAIALLVILLGCMSISIGKFSGTGSCTEADGIFCQEGEVTVSGGAVREVFYPAPYAHTPNLEVSDTFNHCELVEQREGSFKVRNASGFSVTVCWKARGVRAIPPPVPPPLPPPVLPSEPLPAEPTGKAG